LSGKTFDEIESMPIEKLTEALKEFNKIELLNKDAKVKMTFKVKGRRFKCVWQTQKLTAAQYIDVTSFCKDEKNIVANIHNILAAICVEKTWYGKSKKYDGANHKEVADLFYNHLKIDTAYPIMLFFCRYFKELAANILTYLESEANKAMEKTKPIVDKILKANGGGLLQSTT
ncbi:MAG: hypothetical protein ACOVJ8_02845, partial [Sediminibacterium sp.]